MPELTRSAGYCQHCQRGVTVIRPTGNGVFGRLRTVLTNNEDSWVCSKCGSPATKGFAPPPEHDRQDKKGEASAPPASSGPDMITTQSAPATLQAETPEQEGSFTIGGNSGTPPSPGATCHLCSENIPLQSEQQEGETTCPGCQQTVCLPPFDAPSPLTSSPPVTRLDDDPDRPAISKALCSLCQFIMTYPKKLTGKEVDCPSCSTRFTLP